METTWQNHRFPTTRWSVISQVRGGDEGESLQAFDEVSRIYWMPLYAVARFRSLSPEDSEDAVQDFLGGLREGEFFQKVDAQKGKLRTYLRRCFENYLNGEYRRKNRQKRGGDREFLSWDREDAENALGSLEAPGMDLTSLYDRQWALALLRHVLGGLEEVYEKRGESEVFQALSPMLRFDADEVVMKEVAEKLGKTPTALRQSLRRLRARYREAVVEEIHQTLADDDLVEEELAFLMAIFEG